MTNTPDPAAFLADLARTAAEAGSTENMPPLGTFAQQYADAISGSIDTDNVEAFLTGAAVANLIVQEVMHRIAHVATETGKDAADSGDGEGALYSVGVYDGVAHFSQAYGSLIEQIAYGVAETPMVDREFNSREFNSIVSNF